MRTLKIKTGNVTASKTTAGKVRRIGSYIPSPFLSAQFVAIAISLFALNINAAEDSVSNLKALYEERIQQVQLQVHADTERRVAVLHQLDMLMSNMATLSQRRERAGQHAPELADNLSQLENQIAVLDTELNFNTELLQEMHNKLSVQARPSVWHAVLGKPELHQHQQQLAVLRYLLQKTEQNQTDLMLQKQQLQGRRQNLIDYGRGIESSLTTIEEHNDGLIGKQTSLEEQLAQVSAEIVAKQDRIKVLQDRLKRVDSNPDSLQFAKLQKQLFDPVSGPVLKRFKDPKAKGLLEWNGILIAAPLGEPITAVADGSVAFADPIQGLGNVAIVDHGDGYMSLYGMAELLAVEVGQMLLAGDLVGTVGLSVGLDVSALYFEIRHNAETLNPQDWLGMRQIPQEN